MAATFRLVDENKLGLVDSEIISHAPTAHITAHILISRQLFGLFERTEKTIHICATNTHAESCWETSAMIDVYASNTYEWLLLLFTLTHSNIQFMDMNPRHSYVGREPFTISSIAGRYRVTCPKPKREFYFMGKNCHYLFYSGHLQNRRNSQSSPQPHTTDNFTTWNKDPYFVSIK